MRGRGFTLAEVLVGSTLSLLLLGLAVTVWTLASSGWKKTYRLQTAQDSTLVTATRIRDDYRRSKPQSARVDGPVLSFLAFDDGKAQPAWDSTGAVVWKCWVQYRWQNQVLERRQVDLASPGSEPSEPVPAWPDDKKGHLLGRDLKNCSWTLAGVLLEVSMDSEFEKVGSASRLRVLPALYQPD